MMIKNGAKYLFKNLKCQYCGIVFNSVTRNKNQKCCNRSCGQKLAIKLGKKKLFKKGQTAWNKGLKGYNSFKRPKIWGKRISLGIKRAFDNKGRLSTKNELFRKSRKYKEWRKQIFKRDNYICVICKRKSIKGSRIELSADHIKPFAIFYKERLNINNGRTLCRECHLKTDSFGKNKRILEGQYTNQKAIKI